MTKDEVVSLLRAGNLTLCLDTNAISGGSNRFRRCTEIVQQVKSLNAKAGGVRAQSSIRVRVSALVHMEVLFDLRQQHGSRYDPGAVSTGLINAGLEIEDFTETRADEAAKYLGELFPSVDAWHAAKREHLLRRLGLDPAQHRETHTRRSCPATLDWPIAAQAHADGHVLVTDDQGVEFKHVRRKVSVATLIDALRDLLT